MNRAVRCKFECTNIERHDDGADLTFQAAVNGSPENEQFYAFTPSGELKFQTVNPAVADGFRIGAEYYLDITNSSLANEIPQFPGGVSSRRTTPAIALQQESIDALQVAAAPLVDFANKNFCPHDVIVVRQGRVEAYVGLTSIAFPVLD